MEDALGQSPGGEVGELGLAAPTRTTVASRFRSPSRGSSVAVIKAPMPDRSEGYLIRPLGQEGWT